MDSTQLQRGLAALWATRALRSGNQRMIAGVCGGIGMRYRVDPILVRVAFLVTAAFGGSGILLYVAAWIACPTAEPPASPDHTPRLNISPGWVIVIILVILTSPTVITSSGIWGSGGVLGLLPVLVGWWLLYLRTPIPPPGTSIDTAGQSVSTSQVSTMTDLTPTPPPNWDPLGMAKFAWDLPEPSSPEPRNPQRVQRSSLNLIVLGCTLTVGAIGLAAHQLGVAWFDSAHILALCLAAIGLGLIVSAVGRTRTSTRGGMLIPAAIILAVLVLTTTATQSGSPLATTKQVWTPLTENEIRPAYDQSRGYLELDLTQVHLTASRQITINSGVGVVTIRVPEATTVRSDCQVRVGHSDCPVMTPTPTAGPVLTIKARVNVGWLEVIR